MAARTDMSLSKEELFCEAKAQYDHHYWLLDDHPLRSYPTQCIPGLGHLVDTCYRSVQKRWKACLLGAICLICVGLAAFQFFRDLPFRTLQILPRSASAAVLKPRGYESVCIFPHPDTRPNALPLSLAAGCEGIRTAVWLHEDELQVGEPSSDPEANDALQRLSLDSFLSGLESPSTYASSQTPLTVDVPATDSNHDASQTFLLLFDSQSPLPELYPYLVAQLDSLRQRGSLTHWDRGHVVSRPVTVVVTGQDFSGTDCSKFSYSDVFWMASPVEMHVQDGRTSDVLSHVSPICLV